MVDRRINLNMVNPGSGGTFLSINFLKGATGFSSFSGLARFPSILSANGTPSSTGGDGSMKMNVLVPPSYTGSWVIKWTGTGAFKITTDQLITVSAGGGFVTSNSGGVLTVAGTNARVVFQLNAPTNGSWGQTGFPVGTYSNMGEPVLCRLADETAYDSGELFNPDFITALKTLNPKSLRMMQAEAGGAPYCSQIYTHGKPQNYVTWADYYYDPTLYAASDISASAGHYTCSAAPATPGSITQGETIYGWCTTASIGNDTLNVAGRGAKLIIDSDSTTGAGVFAGEIPANAIAAFTYDSVLDGYRFTLGNQALIPGLPIPVMVALCNKVNAGMWFNLPILQSDADALSLSSYVRDNLNGTAYFELGNENWGGAPADPSQILIGWSVAQFGSNTGEALILRYRQIMGQITTGWSPRSMSSLRRVFAWNVGEDSTGIVQVLDGAALSSFGYSAFPNRPRDFTDSISYQTYIEGPNCPAFQGGYIASGQSSLYAAADNYASPNPVLQQAALDFVDNDIRQGTGGNGDFGTLAGIMSEAALYEATLASYDTERIGHGQSPLILECYEGGLQINGPTVATLNALGLNGSLYGGAFIQGFGNQRVVGGRIANLFNAYLTDARFKKFVLDLFNQFMAFPHSRTPSWFDFVGDFSQWSLYPGDLYSTPFKSFDAIADFDKIGTKNLKGDF